MHLTIHLAADIWKHTPLIWLFSLQQSNIVNIAMHGYLEFLILSIDMFVSVYKTDHTDDYRHCRVPCVLILVYFKEGFGSFKLHLTDM